MADKKQYDSFADKYTNVEDLPCSKIEAQLIRTALGDCSDLQILDLGGGSGLHARRAVDAGAARVDVVDISAEMMRVGQGIEEQLGRKEKIRWFEADLARPICEQIKSVGDEGLRGGGYDIVMANWLFDHATSVADLRGMWTNIVAHLKPGGKFLGVRVQSIHADYMGRGKYGATFSKIQKIPGGLKYVCGCLTDPPFSFGCTSMEETYTLRDEIPRELGLVDIKALPPAETDVVKGDPEYWRDFVKDPNLTVITARKP